MMTADAPAGMLGAELRRRRSALRLTMQVLAAALGCSRETLCHAETGRRVPPREWWQRADAMTGAGGKLLRLYEFGPEPEAEPLWPAWGEGRRS